MLKDNYIKTINYIFEDNEQIKVLKELKLVKEEQIEQLKNFIIRQGLELIKNINDEFILEEHPTVKLEPNRDNILGAVDTYKLSPVYCETITEAFSIFTNEFINNGLEVDINYLDAYDVINRLAEKNRIIKQLELWNDKREEEIEHLNKIINNLEE